MAWQKAPGELVALLDGAMSRFECARRVMFGYPAYFVNGNMFVALYEDDVILRLSPEDRQAMQSEMSETRQFEPMPGRPMKEYVVLPPQVVADDDSLDAWLQRSYGFASKLAPKTKKQRSGKRS